MHNENIGDRSFLNNYDELVANSTSDRTDYGFTYAGIRSRIAGHVGARLPLDHAVVSHARSGRRQLVRQPGQDGPTIDGHIWIPIDDEHSWVYNFTYSHDPARPLSHEQRATIGKRGSAAANTSIRTTFPITIARTTTASTGSCRRRRR